LVPQKELQPRAFSVMPLVWTIGSIFGPAIGGALAAPAARHPEIFGESNFLKTYPFALPNIVSSAFFLVGLSVGILCLQETLETKKHRRDCGLAISQVLLHPLRRSKKVKWPHDDESTSSLLKHVHGNSTSTIGDDLHYEARHESVALAPPTYREVFSYQSNMNLLVYVSIFRLLPPILSTRHLHASSLLPFNYSHE